MAKLLGIRIKQSKKIADKKLDVVACVALLIGLRSKILVKATHSVEITDIYSHSFLTKIRENNVLTKEVTKEVI